MEPSLYHGDRVLVQRIAADQVRPGQIVIIETPDAPLAGDGAGPPSRRIAGRRWAVKRVVAGAGEPVPPDLAAAVGARVPPGAVLVLGDNRAWSVDSRHYGPVPAERVLGRVRRRLSGR